MDNKPFGKQNQQHEYFWTELAISPFWALSVAEIRSILTYGQISVTDGWKRSFRWALTGNQFTVPVGIHLQKRKSQRGYCWSEGWWKPNNHTKSTIDNYELGANLSLYLVRVLKNSCQIDGLQIDCFCNIAPNDLSLSETSYKTLKDSELFNSSIG